MLYLGNVIGVEILLAEIIWNLNSQKTDSSTILSLILNIMLFDTRIIIHKFLQTQTVSAEVI